VDSAFLAWLAADALVAAHLGFVMFVALGGLLLLRWPRIAWGHVPAVIWGVTVEFAGWICPLTPLENALRAKAGAAAYSGDFIQQYFLPALYPAGLTRTLQLFLGTFALALNALIYWQVFRYGRTATAKSTKNTKPTKSFMEEHS